MPGLEHGSHRPLPNFSGVPLRCTHDLELQCFGISGIPGAIQRPVIPVHVGPTVLIALVGGLLSPSPDLPHCEIRVAPAVAAGSLDDRVGLGFMNWQYTTSRAGGRLAIAPVGHPGVVALFDSEGEHRESIERPGEGPGEFLSVRGLDQVDDRLYIAHSRGVLILDEVGAVVDEIRTDVVPTGIAVSRDGSFLVSTSAEPAFREFDGGLEAGPRFGTHPDGHSAPLTLVTPARGGGWWTAARNRYALTLYRDGENVRTVTPGEDGFSTWTRQPPGAPFQAPPEPALAGIQEDDDGHLWVALTVPAESWEPRAEIPEIGDLGALGDQVHSRIDLLDAETGARLATLRLDHSVGGFIGPGLLVSREVTEMGIVRIQAWSVSLYGC